MSLFADPAEAAEPLLSVPPISGSAAAAYRVLARKYRPQNFSDLIGQDVLVTILRNAFRMDRVAHAFMLTGVRGVGKTTTARIIARALNCIGADGTGGPTADPCGVCPNCIAILADRHPDVSEMDAASRTGVDDVREIIEATRFRPLQARARVFIIDEVHMLSRNAFNALLKTLEEPPPHVKFVFATTDIRKVPVTVLSRCQRFDLRRVSIAELEAHFARIAATEGVEIEPEALAQIARAAEGSVRDGLSLLDQAIVQALPGEPVRAEQVAQMLGVSDRASLFDLTEAVFAGRLAEALAITERAHERGADLGVMLTDLLDLLHVLSRLKAVPDLRHSRQMAEMERTRGAALADRLEMPALARAWQMLLKGVAEVEAAPDRRAAAEMILIRLCYVADLPPPGELVARLTEQTPARPVPVAVPSAPRGGGGTAQALAPAPDPAPQNSAPLPPPLPRRPQTFRDVVALVGELREPTLHAHLLQSVHLVRFAPPVIELRPQPEAPRDLAARLAAVLAEATGTRWTIALSVEPGHQTIAAQRDEAAARQRDIAADHPLVQTILAAFPGAKLQSRSTHDETIPTAPIEPDGPGFAPIDAEPADDMLQDDRSEEN